VELESSFHNPYSYPSQPLDLSGFSPIGDCVNTQPLPHLDLSATSKMVILEDMILGKGKDVVSLRLDGYSGQHLELRLCLYWAQASFFVFMLGPG
jgi:hypothetical protein